MKQVKGNPRHIVVRRGLGQADGEFPPVPAGGDEDSQTQEEWNGAGTFGLFVTLRSMNDVKDAAEGSPALSWRIDYD